MKTRTTPFFLLSLAILAIGCGVEDRSQTFATPSPEITVALAGTVSGLPGALTFNRQPLHTGSALVTAQGRPSVPVKIRPGSVLRGTATKTNQGYELLSAEVHHEIEGIIERVELTASRLVVMGQTVHVGAHTGIGEEGPDEAGRCLQLADLKAGDRVEVDGFQAADGSVQATRIEQVPPSPDPEGSFHGVISAFDTTSKTALAGGCAVSFGTAQISGSLANGTRVEIHGRLSGKVLRATWMKVETGLEGLSGDTLEICGPISGFNPVAKTFLLMSYQVDYSRAKVEGTLANGASVVAEAPVAALGDAPAALLRVKAGARIELRTLSARADPDGGLGPHRRAAAVHVISLG